MQKLFKLFSVCLVLFLLSACTPVYIQQASTTMNGKCATANGCHYKYKLMPPFGTIFY